MKLWGSAGVLLILLTLRSNRAFVIIVIGSSAGVLLILLTLQWDNWDT